MIRKNNHDQNGKMNIGLICAKVIAQDRRDELTEVKEKFAAMAKYYQAEKKNGVPGHLILGVGK